MSLGLQLSTWIILSGTAMGIGIDIGIKTVLIGGATSLVLSVITLIIRYLEGRLS